MSSDDRTPDLDAIVAAGDPVRPDDLDRLPVLHARQELLEEIMSDPVTTTRPGRRWLVPLGAAAAVAVLAGGAWAATNGDGPSTAPAPDFAGSPSESTGPDPSTPTGTGPGETSPPMFAVTCEQGASLPPRFDPETDTPPDGCAVVLQEHEQTRPEPERYQEPLRPMLITATGWRPDRVDGYDITWTGPGGEELRTTWITTADPDDPWAYDKPGAVAEDRAAELLGVRSRVGEYVRGEVRSFALTSGIFRDGTSVYFTSDTMDADALLEIAGSAAWVSLEEYDSVVKRAVDE